MEIQELLKPYQPFMFKLLGFYVLCCILVVLDLIAGIRKSRLLGVTKIHSYGIRKTIDKLTRYLLLMIAGNVMDCICILSGIPQKHGFAMLPYISTGVVIILAIVEFYSIWEKDENKGKYIEAAKVAKQVADAVDVDTITDKLFDKLVEKGITNENKNNRSISNNNDSTVGDNSIPVEND